MFIWVSTTFSGGREERAWPWSKPLRIKFKDEDREKTIYIFARFHYKKGLRGSDNQEVLERLQELKGNRGR